MFWPKSKSRQPFDFCSRNRSFTSCIHFSLFSSLPSISSFFLFSLSLPAAEFSCMQIYSSSFSVSFCLQEVNIRARGTHWKGEKKRTDERKRSQWFEERGEEGERDGGKSVLNGNLSFFFRLPVSRPSSSFFFFFFFSLSLSFSRHSSELERRRKEKAGERHATQQWISTPVIKKGRKRKMHPRRYNRSKITGHAMCISRRTNPVTRGTGKRWQ